MPGFFDGLLEKTQNPLFLGGLGLLTGGGAQGMMQGMQVGSQFQDRQRKLQQEDARKQALGGALGGLGLKPEEMQFLQADPEVGGAILKSIYADRFDPMAGLRKKQAEAQLAQTQSEAGMTPLKQQLLESQIAQNRAQIEQGRNGKYGLQPVYGTDANGNPIIMQLGPGGEAVQTKLPDGARIDLGIKSREQAAGTAAGKAVGEAKVSLPQAEYNAKKLTSLIDGVLNDPYLAKMTGPISGRLPNLSGASNRIQAKIDQIQGKTFLMAYESLKGSGQITEIEGQKAEASLQRLLNTKVGTEDYIAALQEFRADVEDLLNIARMKAGGGYQPQPQQAPAGGGDWSIRRLD